MREEVGANLSSDGPMLGPNHAHKTNRSCSSISSINNNNIYERNSEAGLNIVTLTQVKNM
jgi:hypothetical protein